MAAPNEDIEPSLRFKRRKLAHPRRAPVSSLHDDFETAATAPFPPAAIGAGTTQSSLEAQTLDPQENEAEAPNLKDILRQRKRPQDRLREAARRAGQRKIMVAKEIMRYEGAETEDGSKANMYADRFVAQTGQVVQRDEGM